MEKLPLNNEAEEPRILAAATLGQSAPNAPPSGSPCPHAASSLGVGTPQKINSVPPRHPAGLHLTAPAYEVPASSMLRQQPAMQDPPQAANDDPQRTQADAVPGNPTAVAKAEPLENGSEQGRKEIARAEPMENGAAQGPTANAKMEPLETGATQGGGGSPRGAARRRKPQRTRMPPADAGRIDQPLHEAAEAFGRAPTSWESDPEISGAEISGESDNDQEGDCEPSSTKHAEASGRGGGRWNSRRRPKGSTAAGRSSRFRGVYWEPKGSKWYSSISYNHKQIHLGSFATEEEAAHAFDVEAVRLRGPNTYTNFPPPPEGVEGLAPTEAPTLTRRRSRRAKAKKASESHDVSEDDEGAAKPLAGAAKALVLLASVPGEETAPKSSRRRPARTSNFREDSPQALLRGQKRKRGGGALSTSPRVDGTGRARSKYTGVYQQSRGNGWFASICVDKTMRYLGTFATEDEAARAFDQEAIRLRGPEIELNLPHEAYLHSPHAFPAPKGPASSGPAKAAVQINKRGPTRTAHQDVSWSDGGVSRGRRVTAGGNSNGSETGGLLDGPTKLMPRRKRRSAVQESALADQDSDEAAESEALAWGRKRRRNQTPPGVPVQGNGASLDAPACEAQAAGRPAAAGQPVVVDAPPSSLQQEVPPRTAALLEPAKVLHNHRLPAPCSLEIMGTEGACADTAAVGTFVLDSQQAEGNSSLQMPYRGILSPHSENGQQEAPAIKRQSQSAAVEAASFPAASSVPLTGGQEAANGYSSGLWMGAQQPNGSAIAVADAWAGL